MQQPHQFVSQLCPLHITCSSDLDSFAIKHNYINATFYEQNNIAKFRNLCITIEFRFSVQFENEKIYRGRYYCVLRGCDVIDDIKKQTKISLNCPCWL